MAYITIDAQRMDYIRRGREEGREEGHKAGLKEGREAGHKAGLKEGREAGRKAGLEEGREAGHRAGFKEGSEKGRESGLEEGRLATLYELVRDQLLSLADAAAKADQTKEEFKAGMDAWLAEHDIT